MMVPRCHADRIWHINAIRIPLPRQSGDPSIICGRQLRMLGPFAPLIYIRYRSLRGRSWVPVLCLPTCVAPQNIIVKLRVIVQFSFYQIFQLDVVRICNLPVCFTCSELALCVLQWRITSPFCLLSTSPPLVLRCVDARLGFHEGGNHGFHVVSRHPSLFSR